MNEEKWTKLRFDPFDPNMCNGVTGFLAVFGGIDSTIDSLTRFRLRRPVPKEGQVGR